MKRTFKIWKSWSSKDWKQEKFLWTMWQKVIQCHRLARICGINLSVFQFLYLMVTKDSMRVGKWLSWHVWTRFQPHQYKFLQLRQYLSGKALKVVKPLGHSAAAYETAKERLEWKFGGKRLQIALHLEEQENFKPLRPENARDLERLADLLNVTVVNLKEASRHEELGSVSLYLSLCRKLTEAILAHYH